MQIDIEWDFLEDDDDRWQSLRCLYAYVAPDKEEILYVGKSWGVTVRSRWNRSGKENFWDDLEEKRGIKTHYVLLGELFLDEGKRLTSQLLADVESLLIINEKPWGNIQSVNSRIKRTGMVVNCNEKWPSSRKYYIDE